MLKKGAGVAVVVVLLVGGKFYNKSSTNKEVKQELIQICEGDADCEAAVNQHFDDCFDASYSMGGRRRSARLDGGQLTSCINQRAGAPYFTVSDE